MVAESGATGAGMVHTDMADSMSLRPLTVMKEYNLFCCAVIFCQGIAF